MGKDKPSIYDIAKKCGVSPAAVSYVINGKNKVSEKTKKKILKAMEEMGYVTDYAAVSLSRGKSSLIGICFPLRSAEEAFADNPFYSEFLASFERETSASGYDVIIGYIKTPEEFERWIISRGISGLALFGLYPPEIYRIISSRKIPMVLTDVYDPMTPAINIRVDDEKGGYLAGKYLIEQGHKNIAFVGGNLSVSRVDQHRYEGLRKSMDEAGIAFDRWFETLTTFDGGYEVADKIASEKDITAVFCGSDIVAIGLMRRLQELGKKIPDEISVIGFDDLKACTYVYPALTSIRQDISLKGKIAAQSLLKTMSNPNLDPITQTIDPVLIIRNSVKSL